MHVRQVAQHAEDLDRAVGFYERLLGQPVTARFEPPGLAFFALGDVRLLLDRSVATSMIYFDGPDVEAAVVRLRDEGYEVTSEPHAIFHHDDDALGVAGTEEWMAFVRDTEGNEVGLISARRS